MLYFELRDCPETFRAAGRPLDRRVQGFEITQLRSRQSDLFFKVLRLSMRTVTAPAVNSFLSDRLPLSLISPSPCTAWATNLGLQINVLHDCIRSSAPEVHGSNRDELVDMMKYAAGTVAAAAALQAARAALASFFELYAQVSSIQGPGIAPAPHMPTQISPDTRNLSLLHPSRSSPRRNDDR